MDISKEGDHFLGEMKIYLLTKGVKESDIESFLEEARQHIIEGEKDGKTVKDIFGRSPKKYAAELAQPMEVSVTDNFKWLISCIIAAFSYLVEMDAISGNIEYSWIEVIGYPVTVLAWIFVVIFGLRTTSFLNPFVQFLIFFLLVEIPLFLTVGVVFLDKLYGEPLLQLNGTASYAVAVATGIVIFLLFVNLVDWAFSLAYVTVIFGVPILFQYFGLTAFYWILIQYITVVGGPLLMFMFKDKKTKTTQFQ